MRRLVVSGFLVIGASACANAEDSANSFTLDAQSRTDVEAAVPVCQVAETGGVLPEAIRESSGLAQGRQDRNVFWTHNDAGNDAELYALDVDGRFIGTVRLEGAEAIDWEDIEAASCIEGDCLYVADTGDNDGERDVITIYEVVEPEAGASSAAARPMRARFPDGMWDTEGLFALGSELYLVTKGRRGPIALYRYPTGADRGDIAVLERVRELFPEPSDNADRVTGATASPDGRWVGLVTISTLYLYPADALVRGGPLEPVSIDLGPLGHSQTEAVAIGEDGTVWLTSEAENSDEQPRWSSLRCTFPAP